MIQKNPANNNQAVIRKHNNHKDNNNQVNHNAVVNQDNQILPELVMPAKIKAAKSSNLKMLWL
jgi:hypothetical protein